MKTSMNMNMNMKMKMKMKMKMNMNSCTKTMYDSFRGRRQRPQAWESADPRVRRVGRYEKP